jgi:hypothetical protein
MIAQYRTMFNLLASSLLHPLSITVMDGSSGKVVGHISRKDMRLNPYLGHTDLEGIRAYLSGQTVGSEQSTKQPS